VTVEHCAITGITITTEKIPHEFRVHLPIESARCFLLVEYLGAAALRPQTAWATWIDAANEFGRDGWEVVQVMDRQIWHGVEAWTLPAPPSTTFYPGKLLIMKRTV
jgi:hypothetical protein